MNKALLPCPFCGKSARFLPFPVSRLDKSGIVTCRPGGCGATISVGSQDEATTAWNRRAASPSDDIAETPAKTSSASVLDGLAVVSATIFDTIDLMLSDAIRYGGDAINSVQYGSRKEKHHKYLVDQIVELALLTFVAGQEGPETIPHHPNQNPPPTYARPPSPPPPRPELQNQQQNIPEIIPGTHEPAGWREFIESIATPMSEPLNSACAYRDIASRKAAMGDLRKTAQNLLDGCGASVSDKPACGTQNADYERQAQHAVTFVHELAMGAYRQDGIAARAKAIARLAPLSAQQEIQS